MTRALLPVSAGRTRAFGGPASYASGGPKLSARPWSCRSPAHVPRGTHSKYFWRTDRRTVQHGERMSHIAHIWPFDLAWGTQLPDVDPQQLAANLFASSIVPYAGFLYHLHRSKQAPKLMLFGWYYLLVFVFATIPAGIYAKLHYHTILANVDWLHGLAESNLTITNLLIVLGLRQGIREAEKEKARLSAAKAESPTKEPEKETVV